MARDNNLNDDTRCIPTTQTGPTTFVGFESVAVPAGIFARCAKVVSIQKVEAEDDSIYEAKTVVFLAPGVGIVKVVAPASSESAIGVVSELLSFAIPGQSGVASLNVPVKGKRAFSTEFEPR